MAHLSSPDLDLAFEDQVFDLEDWVDTLSKIHALEYNKLDIGLEITQADIDGVKKLNEAIAKGVNEFRA